MGIGAALHLPGHAGHPHQRVHRSVPSGPRPSASGPASPAWPSPSVRSPAAGCSSTSAWGSVFLVNVPDRRSSALLVGRLLVPTSRDPHAPRLDPVGLVLSIVGVVSLVWAIIEAPSHGWTSSTILGAFAPRHAAAWSRFILWERRSDAPDARRPRVHQRPVLRRQRRRSRSAFFALFGFIFLVTQYFQFVRGYDTLSAGVRTLPFAVVIGIASPLSARLGAAVRHQGRRGRRPGRDGPSGSLVASTNGSTPPYWGPVVLAMVLIGVGLGLATAPATESIMGSLPPEKAGVGSAVNDTTRELGGTLGVAVLGSVFSSVYGPRLVDALSGVPIPASALRASAGLCRSDPRRRPASRAGGRSGHRQRGPHGVRRRSGSGLPRGGRGRVPRRPARPRPPARRAATPRAVTGTAGHRDEVDAALEIDAAHEIDEIVAVRS